MISKYHQFKFNEHFSFWVFYDVPLCLSVRITGLCALLVLSCRTHCISRQLFHFMDLSWLKFQAQLNCLQRVGLFHSWQMLSISSTSVELFRSNCTDNNPDSFTSWQWLFHFPPQGAMFLLFFPSNSDWVSVLR